MLVLTCHCPKRVIGGMKLSLEGIDPEKHDTALSAAYVTLIILNCLAPLVESTFVTFGDLDETSQNDWLITRRIS